MAKKSKKKAKDAERVAAKAVKPGKAAKDAGTATKGKGSEGPTAPRLSEILRAPLAPFDVRDLDTDAAPGFPGSGKADAPAFKEALEPVLSDLQERLYAAGRADPTTAPRVLLILQGMDTSGKGGVIRHTVGMVDPQGIQLTSFKSPTKEELRHPFLWRIRNALPDPGMLGVFDRSQYEDVLIVRVNELVPRATWSRRYATINNFEKSLADQGYVIIKCFLHVSADEQKERLAKRLDNPDKHWKYNPGDLDTRANWEAYADAYNDMLAKCNPEHAPWYIIPADKKWYRNWAVAELLREKLADLGLGWPEADFDVAAEKARLAEL
ncbi:PPK2 family polyphosphate kinase [Nigerium massiliense]|uniref:PPK2 family polyphosphate kinase n=1 Tax=Nigerium massiliense TaxID=1522317 RepID=UPI0009E19FC4|nr:PPK2 family polyphosphate kinase [Nigerium massiliense]